MEDLALYLLSNISKEFSYSTLTKITRCKSVHTVEKYLNYLEESFLFFRLNRFSYKVREQVNSNKKIYCIDNGLIHAKAFRIGSDVGRLCENAVAAELKRAEAEDGIVTYFWKNPQQEEVDFLVKKGRQIKQLIQVCYDISEPEARKREERALLNAGKELKCKNLLIITGDYEAQEEAEWFGIKGKIRYIPLHKWLLTSRWI
jgi:predicted AAA+ superfamily ATPase